MIEKVPYSFTLAERLDFYSMPEPNSGCQLWIGPMHHTGYGQIYFAGKAYQAHRAAWLAKGMEVPDHLCVCHKCDVRSCINTDHHFLGTKGDNNRDARIKGRVTVNYGSDLYNARLSIDLVRAMRLSLESDDAWAARLGVAKATVNHARSGRTWAHVAMVPE